MVPRD